MRTVLDFRWTHRGTAFAALAILLSSGCGQEQPHADAPSPPSAQTYDITAAGGGAEPAPYVPTVDLFTVLNFSVESDHGGTLHIGHPVEMRAEIEVQAEPFESVVWYGLQSDDGRHCVIDHVALEHLGAMFEAAERANVAVAQHDDGIPQPSLQDCAEDGACPDGEECVAFQQQVDTHYQPLPDDLADPRQTIPHEPEAGAAPDGTDFETVTSYLCATTTYAATEVSRAKSAPKLLNPADLAGSVRQRHLLGATDELPAACESLIGAGSLTAWIAFDPEEETNFIQRPERETAVLDGDAPELAEDVVLHNREEDAFAQRLPESVSVEAVLPDPGLDVDFRHLAVGSSVVLIDQEDHPGGDFHVDAEYSLDGAMTAEQEAGMADAEVLFHFTLQPVGEPRPGCVPPEPAPSLGAVPVAIVHSNPDHTGTDVMAEAAHELGVGSGHDQSFPLYLPPEVREKVYGEWACWDQFDVEGCLSTNIDQASEMGTDDDCAVTTVVFLRDNPPEGAVIEPPPPALAHARSARVGNPGCGDSLFRAYAENMKKYYELENRVQVTDNYTYDFSKWLWGSLTPGSKGVPAEPYVTNEARRSAYYNHIKCYLEECDARGGQGCWTSWCFNNSPWSIDVNYYKNSILPYFWNAYGRSGAENYFKFRNNPQDFTRGFFNYECSGIASGAVCSAINYDLNRLPELAGRIRDVLGNRRYSDPLNAQMSPNGAGRCIDRGYPPLQRTNIEANGRLAIVPDDDVFYTQYLAQVCEKGRYKAEADRIWKEIASSCTYVSKPFADSGAGIYAGRFAPDLYRTYDTGFKAGLKGVVEGGVVNDYLVSTPLQQFKLVFGAQGRVYLESDPNNDIVGGINVYDIFKTWMLGNFYNDILSSNVEAGFHVLTHDVWKISFRLPTGEFELPDPPELSKEKEKCKYLWKPPMPFRIELCGAVGGKVDLTVEAKVLKTGIAGADPQKADWPGVSGTITPGVAITNKGRAGVDVFIASAGLVINIDPTIGVFIPVEVGAKWNLAMPAPRQLNFTLAPYVKTTLELRALGGSIAGYTRWKIGNTEESTYPIPGAEWDPLDIGNLLGQEWVLSKHTWDISGSKVF